MKKIKNLALLLFMLFIADSAFAARSVVVSRTKSCFIGCGSTSRTERIVEYVYANGRTEIINEITIACSGFGTEGCPSSMAYGNNPSIGPEFDRACASNHWDFALNALSLGSTSGSNYGDYYNTALAETWRFTAEWSVISGVESVTVYKELISW